MNTALTAQEQRDVDRRRVQHLDALDNLHSAWRSAYLAGDKALERRVQRSIDELNDAYWRPAKVKAPRPEPRPVTRQQWQSMTIRVGTALVLGSGAVALVGALVQ